MKDSAVLVRADGLYMAELLILSTLGSREVTMGEPGTLKNDVRRSTRILLSIPVEVSGWDVEGREIHEKTTTSLVNKHGARISLQQKISVGSNVVISIPHLKREQRCRVIWMSCLHDDRDNYQIGVELERPDNFWGVDFPPGDWDVSTAASLMGNLPG